MREVERAQALDAQHRQPGVNRGLDIGREESSRFRRMLVDVHVDLKGLFDRRHGSVDIHDEPIGKGVRNLQSVGLRETDHALIVDHRRRELLGELLHGEEMAVVRTGLIVQLMQ
jgi:hypothetical protein